MDETPDELGEKIRKARDRDARPEIPRYNVGNGGGKALRAATDFSAAIVIGILLGYWIDRWLGTKPWGIMIFLVLGFVAGVLNIHRAEMEEAKKSGNDNDKKA